MSFARWTVMLALLGTAVALSGCMVSHDDGGGGVRAINLRTGESRDFSDASEVPPGWVVCAPDGCPAPVACSELDEASCLARIDCEATYADTAPPECIVPPGSGRPVPAYCGSLPFVGCSVGSTGCGVFPACLLACPPGTHNPVDADGCVHTCECVPDDACGPDECGPALGAPAIVCADGSIGGNTGRCLRNADGACGWELRECPTPPPPPPPPTECAAGECGPALGIPAIMCSDGSIGGNTGRCLRNADGACGWELRECPPDAGACSATECGPAPGAIPMCRAGGGTGGGGAALVCERALDGTCGWHYSCGECSPADCGPAPGADPMCPVSGGTPGVSASLSCERGLDGACGWHFSCG